MDTGLRSASIAAGAAAAFLVAFMHGGSIAGIFQASLAFMLCCIAAHDVATRRIENATVVVIACLRLYELALGGFAGRTDVVSALLDSAASSAIVLAMLLATAWLSVRFSGGAGIGGGDVKLLWALGFSLGWETALAIACLSCILLVVGTALPPRNRREATHAFAPYIAVSTLLALLAL